MHAGRILIMLRQYLDQRLTAARAWQRAAAGTGMIILALAGTAIAVLAFSCGTWSQRWRTRLAGVPG